MNKTTEPAALAGIEPVATVKIIEHLPDGLQLVAIFHPPFNVADGYKLYSAATVERLVQERDRLQTIDLDLQMAVQKLAAMTQERDDLLQARAICPECAKKIDEAAGIDLVGLNRQLAASQAEITRLGGVCSDYRKTQEALLGDLAASQAREQQLREALDICKREMQGDKWDALYIDGVLASK